MPSIFVPLAEQMGLIGVLGQWVLRQACRQLHEWERQGLAVPRLAVNVSGAQLRRPEEFEAEVAKAFAFYGVRRHAIEFELTETVLMDVSQKQADAITRLQALGATIAIDDFGTGYSSLRYLTTYPIQRLKIAQDLIAKISSDSRNAVVVRSTIRLAEDLGIAVIAEGVERAEQMRILLDAGCEYAQGYYFNRPMAATDVALLLARLDSAIPGDAQSSATAA
jgi:EAL domain-containing protein (putative c-di-GMP-specific phosphodiesterase class I)